MFSLSSNKFTSRKHESLEKEIGLRFPFLAKKKTKLDKYSSQEIKEVKKDHSNDPNASVFNPKKYKVAEDEEDNKVQYVIKSLKSGRVRFDNIRLAPDAPCELICEECEKTYAILRCDACDQLMCAQCADLCHPRTMMGTKLHNHETRDKIRAIRSGDVSRVNNKVPFALPACDVFEDDLAALKDLSIPGSLASYSKVAQPTAIPFRFPKFTANEKVIFKDPNTGKDAYGRIISDWDFLHGDVAPAVKRGEGSAVWYVVEMKDLIDKVNISEIIKLLPPKPPPIEYPVLDGLVDQAYRHEYTLAQRVTDKVEVSRVVHVRGPKQHFLSNEEANDYDPNHLPPIVSDSGPPLYGNLDEYKSFPFVVEPCSWAQSRGYDHALGFAGFDTHEARRNPVKYYHQLEYIKKALNLFIFAEDDLVRPEDKIDVLNRARFAAIENVVERQFMKMIHRMMVWGFSCWKNNMEHLKEQQVHYCARKIQSHFRRWRCRFLLDQLAENWEKELQRRWRELHRPFHYCTKETRFSVTFDGKMYFETGNYANRYAACLRKNMQKVIKFTDRKRLFFLRAFIRRWKHAVDEFNENDLRVGHFAHETVDVEEHDDIQGMALHRQEVMKIHEKLKRRGPKAVGMDDLDHDNVAAIPLSPTRGQSVVTTQMVERIRTRTKSSADSPGGSGTRGDFSKGNNSPGSGNPASSGNRRANKEVVLEAEECEVWVPPYHPRIGMSAGDDASSSNITNGSPSKKDGAPKAPSLPPLLPILMPKTSEDRINLSDNRRLTYCSYKAYMEGPTDHSCWVIPGRLAIGKMPYMTAHSKTAVTAVSCLFLGGLDTYVSLMTEEEEIDAEIEKQVPPIPTSLQTGLNSAKFAANQLIIESNEVITKQKEILEAIPHYFPADPRYQQAHREKLRCKARLKMADAVITKARSQLQNIPTQYQWFRLPMESDRVPTVHEILPWIWDLETRLSQGRNIFLYSREGHGRVGLFAACILGRLYGLTPYEALYRVQASHDSAKCEENRSVRVHCPQLSIQRKLVTDVLSLTNRIYDGITWRSHNDPETQIEEVHRIPRGHRQGLSGMVVDPSVVHVKDSVRFAIDLPKDVTFPPKLAVKADYDQLEASQPPLEELYHRELQTNIRDVVRKIDAQYPEPAARPKLPLIRTAKEA